MLVVGWLVLVPPNSESHTQILIHQLCKKAISVYTNKYKNHERSSYAVIFVGIIIGLLK